MPLKKIYELINRFMPAIVGLCIILESAFFSLPHLLVIFLTSGHMFTASVESSMAM